MADPDANDLELQIKALRILKAARPDHVDDDPWFVEQINNAYEAARTRLRTPVEARQ